MVSCAARPIRAGQTGGRLEMWNRQSNCPTAGADTNGF